MKHPYLQLNERFRPFVTTYGRKQHRAWKIDFSSRRSITTYLDVQLIFFCFGDKTVSRISKISFCGLKQILKSFFNPCMIADPPFFRNCGSSFAHLSWFPRFVIIQAQRQRQIPFMFLYSKDRSFDPRSKKNNLLTFLCLKIDFIHWYRMHEI